MISERREVFITFDDPDFKTYSKELLADGYVPKGSSTFGETFFKQFTYKLIKIERKVDETD